MTKLVKKKSGGGVQIATWQMCGRLPKFESPDALVKLFKKYFKDVPFEQWSITGLALSCGTSRRTLSDYEIKPEFKEVITQAKSMVEHSYEMSMRKNGRTTDIFALKNFGWKDEYINDNKHSGEIKTGINWIGSANIIQKQAINAIDNKPPKVLCTGEDDGGFVDGDEIEDDKD